MQQPNTIAYANHFVAGPFSAGCQSGQHRMLPDPPNGAPGKRISIPRFSTFSKIKPTMKAAFLIFGSLCGILTVFAFGQDKAQTYEVTGITPPDCLVVRAGAG